MVYIKFGHKSPKKKILLIFITILSLLVSLPIYIISNAIRSNVYVPFTNISRREKIKNSTITTSIHTNTLHHQFSVNFFCTLSKKECARDQINEACIFLCWDDGCSLVVYLSLCLRYIKYIMYGVRIHITLWTRINGIQIAFVQTALQFSHIYHRNNNLS
jgi:uncharacterized membrane protein YoaK (UPF0700 family)